MSGAMDIEAMLPHRPPLLMISGIIEHDADGLTATGRVDRDNPLLQDGALPGHAGLEMIAQASGVWLGLSRKGEAGPGAIVTVRDMRVHLSWLDGEKEIIVKSSFMGGDERAAMFHGTVFVKGDVAVEATIMVGSFAGGGLS